MFDIANCVACIDRKNGHRELPSPENVLKAPLGKLEISKIARQPYFM